ncbi:MAG: hypothetical protein J5808_04155 [Paludibacteraceae bacterium]|nr:hypothetical protein [Paludibacteraceae bacterium]
MKRIKSFGAVILLALFVSCAMSFMLCSCQAKRTFLQMNTCYHAEKHTIGGTYDVCLEFSDTIVVMRTSRRFCEPVHAMSDTGAWKLRNDSIYVQFNNISIHRQLMSGPYIPNTRYVFRVKGRKELYELGSEGGKSTRWLLSK